MEKVRGLICSCFTKLDERKLSLSTNVLDSNKLSSQNSKSNVGNNCFLVKFRNQVPASRQMLRRQANKCLTETFVKFFHFSLWVHDVPTIKWNLAEIPFRAHNWHPRIRSVRNRVQMATRTRECALWTNCSRKSIETYTHPHTHTHTHTYGCVSFLSTKKRRSNLMTRDEHLNWVFYSSCPPKDTQERPDHVFVLWPILTTTLSRTKTFGSVADWWMLHLCCLMDAVSGSSIHIWHQ